MCYLGRSTSTATGLTNKRHLRLVGRAQLRGSSVVQFNRIGYSYIRIRVFERAIQDSRAADTFASIQIPILILIPIQSLAVAPRCRFAFRAAAAVPTMIRW